MRFNLPSILQTIYMEDRHRLKDYVEDERAVLQAFENRKADNRYFQLLERGVKR
jgi:hypothetical protein